jgi:hypothetical protein
VCSGEYRGALCRKTTKETVRRNRYRILDAVVSRFEHGKKKMLGCEARKEETK